MYDDIEIVTLEKVLIVVTLLLHLRGQLEFHMDDMSVG